MPKNIDVTILEQYPELIYNLIEYIERTRKEVDSPLLSIIIEFCEVNDYPIELLADAISTDVYFKDFLMTDCINNKYIRTDPVCDSEEW